MIGFFITPIALGNSGQRSRTSKMNLPYLIILEKIPGIAAVKGVEVANNISKSFFITILRLFIEKYKNLTDL